VQPGNQCTARTKVPWKFSAAWLSDGRLLGSGPTYLAVYIVYKYVFPEPLSRRLEHSVTGLGLEAANGSSSAVFHNGQGWDGRPCPSARNNSIVAAQHRQQHSRSLRSRSPARPRCSVAASAIALACASVNKCMSAGRRPPSRPPTDPLPASPAIPTAARTAALKRPFTSTAPLLA
jgi:hypothetical protein